MAPSFGGMLLYEGDLKMRDCGVARFVIAPFYQGIRLQVPALWSRH